MLKPDSPAPENITSDAQVRGFEVEMRQRGMRDINYTLSILPGYGELQVRTRNGECDMAFAQFYQKAGRASCETDAETCRSLSSLDRDVNGVIRAASLSWEPYRCCANYGPNLFPMDIKALYRATRASQNFFESFFNMVSSAFFVNFLCFTFVVGSLFSHAVWIGERTNNQEQFPPGYFSGIDDSMWWAVTTFTTVGYGDKAPESSFGRGVGAAWMILGVTLSSVLTGHMAAAFSESQTKLTRTINSPSDLQGLRVCGYAATFQSWYLPESLQLGEKVEGASVAECGKFLMDGRVDAVVMDSPIIQFWARTDQRAKSMTDFVLSPPFATEPVSVLYADGFDLADEMDKRFLELFEDVAVRDMYARWFGSIEMGDIGKHTQLAAHMLTHIHLKRVLRLFCAHLTG